MADPVEILRFWYGDDPEAKRDEWFHGGPSFDEQCRRFRPDWEAARAGELDGWLTAPTSLLAFVLLTDQIPRNMFRDDGRAYATDAQALAAAQRAVAHGWDLVMRKRERQFLHLPFEHAEDLAMQAECLRLFRALGDDELVGYAQAHYDIIERFGRFPHRNAMLGRTSTPEELAFVAEHGRGF